jgi:hypothetical protein
MKLEKARYFSLIASGNIDIKDDCAIPALIR